MVLTQLRTWPLWWKGVTLSPLWMPSCAQNWAQPLSKCWKPCFQVGMVNMRINQSKKYRPRVTELMEHASLRWTAQDSPSLPHLESRFFPPLIALSQCLVETVQTVVNVINIKAITNIAQNNTWYNQFLPYPALSFCAYWAKQVQQVQPEEPHVTYQHDTVAYINF